MKEKSQKGGEMMDKIKRLSVCVVYFSVVFSVILGIITRSSYKDINPYDVPLHTHIIDCCDSVIKDLSISKMQNKLKRMKNVFIVTVNEKEFVYRSIKSIMTVEEVNLLLLLGPYHFCPLLSPSLHEMFPWYL